VWAKAGDAMLVSATAAMKTNFDVLIINPSLRDGFAAPLAAGIGVLCDEQMKKISENIGYSRRLISILAPSLRRMLERD
jgi:hypothetical protein